MGAKLPNFWPFTYLKGKAKKADSDDSSTEEDKGSKSNSNSKKSAARPKSRATGGSSGNGGATRDAPAPQTQFAEPSSSRAGDMFGQSAAPQSQASSQGDYEEDSEEPRYNLGEGDLAGGDFGDGDLDGDY